MFKSAFPETGGVCTYEIEPQELYMKILMTASEAFPFCKTGGLADVVGALAQNISRHKGFEVALFLPRYRNIGGGAFSLEAVPGVFEVQSGNEIETVSLSTVKWGHVNVYFINNPKYFDRPDLYRNKQGGDFGDNAQRFMFFSKAVIEAAKFISFKPDIIHCHDWQTGLVAAYLDSIYKYDAFFARTAVVFNIHNMAYQGTFSKEVFVQSGLGWENYRFDRFEYFLGINYLKAGIVASHKAVTVSPTYRYETCTSEEKGRGLKEVLLYKGEDYAGILNGIDTEVWSPEYDGYLGKGYDESSFVSGKSAAKTELRKLLGLNTKSALPIAGMVTRLDAQKGVDMVLNIIPRFADKIQFIILGQGDPHYKERLMALALEYPDSVYYCDALDEAMAHRIYAASDMYLMPSRFEPCGLSQMIALRYGALPVVSRTGGLADTIKGCCDTDKPNGFFMQHIDDNSLGEAITEALELYTTPKKWHMVVRNAMLCDFSWDASVGHYIDIFYKAYEKKNEMSYIPKNI